MSSDWESLLEAVELARRRVARLQADMRSNEVMRRAATPVPRVTTASIDTLMAALDTFPTLVGYANGRRPKGALLAIDSEASVQDLLYFSLKSIFADLIYEQPTEKGAVGYSVGDFTIPSLKLILEAKYVGKRADVKARADEIAEDIWKYATETDCERIVFFVYDPALLIPDRTNFARTSSARAGEFKAKGREVEIVTVVKP